MKNREVSKEEFFKHIGNRDVYPTPEGKWPYTSVFRTRDRIEVGRIVETLPENSPFPVSRYYI